MKIVVTDLSTTYYGVFVENVITRHWYLLELLPEWYAISRDVESA